MESTKQILETLNTEGFVVVQTFKAYLSDDVAELFITPYLGEGDETVTLMTVAQDWLMDMEENDFLKIMDVCADRAFFKHGLRTLELSYIQDEFDEVYLSIRAIWL